MIRLFRGRLCVSIFSVILLLIISLSADAVFFYIALLGAFCHELAHIVAMRVCGARAERITVYPCGADIRANLSALSLNKEIFVFCAGPLINLAIALLALLLYRLHSDIYVLAVILSNLALFTINAFPVKGLDGGRVLFSVLLKMYDTDKAYGIFGAVSCTAFALLGALSLVLVWLSGYNLSLVLVWTYLFVAEYVKGRTGENA